MKTIKVECQIIKSLYMKEGGGEGESYTLCLLLPGRSVMVKPLNPKNYGAIVGLAENNPESIVIKDDRNR